MTARSRSEVGSGGCQAVPDLPPAGLPVGGDDSGILKLAQALAEDLGGDPAEAVHQVGEPLGASEKSRITSRLRRSPTCSRARATAQNGSRFLAVFNVPPD